jgi:hypothetical protein
MAGQPAAGEGEEEPDVRPMMRAAALSVTGDFLLLAGIIFVLLGVANFLTGLLGIKGSGEFLVGFFIIAVAAALLLHSGQLVPRIVPKAPKVQKPMDKTESYR